MPPPVEMAGLIAGELSEFVSHTGRAVLEGVGDNDTRVAVDVCVGVWLPVGVYDSDDDGVDAAVPEAVDGGVPDGEGVADEDAPAVGETGQKVSGDATADTPCRMCLQVMAQG